MYDPNPRRRIYTIALIIGSVIFSGLAIFLAYTIQKRNVSVTETDAAQNCTQVRDDKYNSCFSKCNGVKSGQCDQDCVNEAVQAAAECENKKNNTSTPKCDSNLSCYDNAYPGSKMCEDSDGKIKYCCPLAGQSAVAQSDGSKKCEYPVAPSSSTVGSCGAGQYLDSTSCNKPICCPVGKDCSSRCAEFGASPVVRSDGKKICARIDYGYSFNQFSQSCPLGTSRKASLICTDCNKQKDGDCIIVMDNNECTPYDTSLPECGSGLWCRNGVSGGNLCKRSDFNYIVTCCPPGQIIQNNSCVPATSGAKSEGARAADIVKPNFNVVDNSTTQTQYTTCNTLSFTTSGGSSGVQGQTVSRIPAAGETFNFSSTGVTWGPNTAYEIAIRPVNADPDNACSYYTYLGIEAAKSTWIMPTNGATRTQAAQVNRLYSSREPTWDQCSSTPLDFSQGMIVSMAYISPYWCSPRTLTGTGALVDSRSGTKTVQQNACTNSCFIRVNPQTQSSTSPGGDTTTPTPVTTTTTPTSVTTTTTATSVAQAGTTTTTTTEGGTNATNRGSSSGGGTLPNTGINENIAVAVIGFIITIIGIALPRRFRSFEEKVLK